ncbi:LacI family transcriptional regulator [Vibrio hangzhouensis]|uniref:Transcriptional regulator, LacI family n=1 Tax=Vibrio hangzhouensis TaxID=462991 RepID=A0A1H5TIL9_9VIBR|nr:LacI family transcriptional regulator [Vibrio hangzhouensis]SEF62655.1 transcriptional regulator, LacI family [Vibrio hangzhouensis]
MSRPTLKTIVEKSGLSVATVSRALKNDPAVRPETIERVKKIAREINYKPNSSGISLRTGKSFVVCAILPVSGPGENNGDMGTLSLVDGLTTPLLEAGYHLMVLPDSSSQNSIELVKYVVDKNLADALIINRTLPNDARVRYLNSVDFPFITFGRTELSFEHPFYDVDNSDFTYRAATELLKNGRKDIRLFMPNENFSYTVHQFSGLRRAAYEFGIEISMEENVVLESEISSYREFARKQSAAPSCVPDGWICGSESIALGLAAGFIDSNIDIGRELDIVMLETTSISRDFTFPVISYFQDMHEVGKNLSKMILSRLNNEKVECLQKLDVVNGPFFRK